MTVNGALWRKFGAVQIYGANTDVGKTIFSTLLCNGHNWSFLKPVSTGPRHTADDIYVKRFVPKARVRCLYQFDEPISPHLAAERGRTPVPTDSEILSSICNTITAWAPKSQFTVVETAGGVHSPGPNGTSQADLYRPLRLPVVLVADSRLGGISSTISAFESLLVRGYDVHYVLLFKDQYYKNHNYLRTYFKKRGIPVQTVNPPPERPALLNEETAGEDEKNMQDYYSRLGNGSTIKLVRKYLAELNKERADRLDEMAGQAKSQIWYPFTQHYSMKKEDISVIESAYGDFFQVYNPQTHDSVLQGDGDPKPHLQATFDGSASWWTQGLGHGNPELSLSAAYAAGRYGHVMFPGNIHEPALNLASLLIERLQNPRLQKVFYSDNGSTGVEVAVKMALRATCARYNWDASKEEIKILGLKGSYHGDTIGVMDCSEPSTFNKKVEWYRGRGFWFDFPRVQMTQGKWEIQIPESLKGALGETDSYESLSDMFDLKARIRSDLAHRYHEYIRKTLLDLVHNHGIKFGALILEPIVLGAGGMHFCDPLFQRVLVKFIRSNHDLFAPEGAPLPQPGSWSGLPVIFDEVFTGLYRLGYRTAAHLINVHPDISVFAKLLTGGLVPLCTTLASNEIFRVFETPEKSDALLHGHSYTAHPVGCNVAVDSLRSMMQMDELGKWEGYSDDWLSGRKQWKRGTDQNKEPRMGAWSVWSKEFVGTLSNAEPVDGVWSLGTVLAISLKDEHGGGYTSNAAKGLQAQLASSGEFAVHSRVLGNVLYLMASLTSETKTIRQLEEMVRGSLDLPPGPKLEPNERKAEPIGQEGEFSEEAERSEEEAESSVQEDEQEPLERLEAEQHGLNRNLNLLNRSLNRYLQDK